MQVKITVTEDPEYGLFGRPHYMAKDDYRGIEMTAYHASDAIDGVKGAVLIALGQRRHPPDKIEFSVVWKCKPETLETETEKGASHGIR